MMNFNFVIIFFLSRRKHRGTWNPHEDDADGEDGFFTNKSSFRMVERQEGGKQEEEQIPSPGEEEKDQNGDSKVLLNEEDSSMPAGQITVASTNL